MKKLILLFLILLISLGSVFALIACKGEEIIYDDETTYALPINNIDEFKLCFGDYLYPQSKTMYNMEVYSDTGVNIWEYKNLDKFIPVLKWASWDDVLENYLFHVSIFKKENRYSANVTDIVDNVIIDGKTVYFGEMEKCWFIYEDVKYEIVAEAITPIVFKRLAVEYIKTFV